MGQDIVARDKVELHSSCVILEGQEALPHNGVLLFKGKQTEVSSCVDMALGSRLAVLNQVGIFGHLPQHQAWRGAVGGPPRLTFRSWTISTGLWEVKCGEESCLGEGWASVYSRANPGGVLGPEVVETNNGCFGAAWAGRGPGRSGFMETDTGEG